LDKKRATQRLFFALWPHDEERAKVTKLQQSLHHLRGKPVARDNLHITLIFIGAVDSRMRVCLETRAGEVEGKAFELRLLRLGHFTRSRVVWLGPDQTPESARSLVDALNARLQVCGLRPKRRAFSAHMTLFRKAVPADFTSISDPIQWKVDSFFLVESQTRPEGVQYRIVKHFPLTPV
jgi:2'-5' RNA ligase